MKKSGTAFSHTLQAKYVNPELWGKIQQLNLNLIFERMVSKHGWTEERTEKAIAEYRQFLYLSQMFEQPISPTGEIDAVWHEHILHTNKYALDCNKLFGRFLHHFPTPPKWAKEMAEKSSCAGGECQGSCSNDSCDSGTTNCQNRTAQKINFDDPAMETNHVSVGFEKVAMQFFLS